MDIFLLNQTISIQQNTVLIDEIGNHTNVWMDYFTCKTTVGGEAGNELEKAGELLDTRNLSFTIRYCSEVSKLDTTHYRIIFEDDIYNIIRIDHMNYKKKSIKIWASKVRR